MSTRTSIRTRASKAEGLTIAYTLGQLTQLFLHWMCLENNLYVYRQILFCSIAGAVLLVAIIIGTVIGEDKAYYGSHEEREEDIGYHPVEKTYIEYAKEAEAQETAVQESMEEGLAIMPIVNAMPLLHVTLHPRLGRQQYKGAADRDAFCRFYAVNRSTF